MNTTISMDGFYVFGESDEQMKVLQMRGKFSKKYCEQKGWDMNNLTFEQILEIRQRPEWKNPIANQKAG